MNIKEAAEKFDLTIDTLRYYERMGVIPPVSRDSRGYRYFQTKDLNWIFLARSLRKAGLSIESMIEFCSLAQQREDFDVTGAQKKILHEQLEEVEIKIKEMNEVRELLQYKIESYDDHIAQFKAGKVLDEKLWERNKA